MRDRYVPFGANEIPGLHELAQALDTDSRTTRDVAHGQGEAMTLGESMTELQVFPAAGVVRATTESSALELHRVTGYTVRDAGHVVFEAVAETEQTRMSVRPDGEVYLQSREKATESTTSTATPPPSTTSVEQPPQTALEGPTDTPQSADQNAPEGEQPTEVTITDRIGRDPWSRTVDGEVTRGFLLAHNHTEGEKPIWYHVSARGDVADQVEIGVRERWIRKGRVVTVTGVPSEPSGRSTTRSLEATAVRKPDTSVRPKQGGPGS